MDLSEEQIPSIIHRFVQDSLSQQEELGLSRRVPFSPDEIDDRLNGIWYVLDDARNDLASCDYRGIENIVDDVLDDAGVVLDKDSHGYKVLSRELLKANIKFLEIEEKRSIGDYSLTDEDKTWINPPQLPPVKGKTETSE